MFVEFQAESREVLEAWLKAEGMHFDWLVRIEWETRGAGWQASHRWSDWLDSLDAVLARAAAAGAFAGADLARRLRRSPAAYGRRAEVSSVVAQRDEWVDLQGAARWDVAGDQRDDQQHRGNAYESPRVHCADAE